MIDIKKLEPTSYLWHKQFLDNHLPRNGVVVEVAPGYEPKIGNALALYGFTGTIFLIEPDGEAAKHIQKIYQEILPQAIIKMVVKPLENIQAGIDIYNSIDALLASHPFDDMVMASIVNQTSFFSEEKNNGAQISAFAKNLYTAIKDEDYKTGIRNTITVWQKAIQKLKPAYFIASQYPSRTLTVKGLWQRQESGFTVLRELKNFYKDSLEKQRHDQSFGYRGDPRWWIVAKNPHNQNPSSIILLPKSIEGSPLAIKRLDKSIFIPQQVRQLDPKEYEIVYIDKKYFKDEGYYDISKYIKNFAITLDYKDYKGHLCKTYADRQKDQTGISLSGNLGSGRAVYYGTRFNILGVGKTTLCQSTKPSHSTGKLELIGAMRRIVLSKWINYFTPRTPAHPLLITLKEAAKFKWNLSPIPLAILVRVDDGSLDRPSHIEYAPQIPIDFQKTLTEYAHLDAECFTYRIMLGAWSTSNYSLSGHMIDLETATFTKYRGPYYTACSKYPENRFGYEGLGLIRILQQLASIKNINNENIETEFYKKRSEHLGQCFLSLLGIQKNLATAFLGKHQNTVMAMAHQFEKLAKNISPHKTNLNLYLPVADCEDPSLLDMSGLFKNLAKLYASSSDAETKALDCLVRKSALAQVKCDTTRDLAQTEDRPQTLAETFIKEHATITRNELDDFLRETKKFIQALFNLLAVLDSEKCLDKRSLWNDRLQTINQNLPPMFELNAWLRNWAEQYRLGKISAKNLGSKIKKLSTLPQLALPAVLDYFDKM